MNAVREVDLLVAGAGAAGMTAALVAAIEGLDVLLCEKSPQVGGTAATSAGTLWIPGNSQSRAAGFSDDTEQARHYLDALIGEGDERSLRETFLSTGPQAIDYLEAHSDVAFLPCGPHPDYRSNMPGAAYAGRAVIPRPFDGRLLGRNFARLRPPIPEFLLLGGMMIGKADIAPLIGRFRSASNFVHTAKLVARYAMDRMRHPRGTRLTMGNALVGRLYYSLLKRNVPVLFNAAIAELVREGERVSGARLVANGQAFVVKARRGVVLATGGYGHNDKFRRAFMPQPVPAYSMSFTGNTGDGIALAEQLQARIGPARGGSGLWAPVSLVPRGDGNTGLFPHLVLDRAKPGLIAVNKTGRRFVNEACSYHDFVLAMFETHDCEPSIPAYLVCDAAFVMKYGLGAVYPGGANLRHLEQRGYLTRAQSIQTLAEKIGVDAQQLAVTVVRHNSFAETGIDADFGKGETELNRFNGDATHKPNPCIGPIRTPPFYALAVYPADIAVSTGLATDADARVLSVDGGPIPGLYACGNDMDSVMAGTYPGPGTTLGPAVVFAYRAVMHARTLPMLNVTISES